MMSRTFSLDEQLQEYQKKLRVLHESERAQLIEAIAKKWRDGGIILWGAIRGKIIQTHHEKATAIAINILNYIQSTESVDPAELQQKVALCAAVEKIRVDAKIEAKIKTVTASSPASHAVVAQVLNEQLLESTPGSNGYNNKMTWGVVRALFAAAVTLFAVYYAVHLSMSKFAPDFRVSSRLVGGIVSVVLAATVLCLWMINERNQAKAQLLRSEGETMPSDKNREMTPVRRPEPRLESDLATAAPAPLSGNDAGAGFSSPERGGTSVPVSEVPVVTPVGQQLPGSSEQSQVPKINTPFSAQQLPPAGGAQQLPEPSAQRLVPPPKPLFPALDKSRPLSPEDGGLIASKRRDPIAINLAVFDTPPRTSTLPQVAEAVSVQQNPLPGTVGELKKAVRSEPLATPTPTPATRPLFGRLALSSGGYGGEEDNGSVQLRRTRAVFVQRPTEVSSPEKVEESEFSLEQAVLKAPNSTIQGLILSGGSLSPVTRVRSQSVDNIQQLEPIREGYLPSWPLVRAKAVGAVVGGAKNNPPDRQVMKSCPPSPCPSGGLRLNLSLK